MSHLEVLAEKNSAYEQAIERSKALYSADTEVIEREKKFLSRFEGILTALRRIAESIERVIRRVKEAYHELKEKWPQFQERLTVLVRFTQFTKIVNRSNLQKRLAEVSEKSSQFALQVAKFERTRNILFWKIQSLRGGI